MAGNVIPLRRSSRIELAKLHLHLLNAVLDERALAASQSLASRSGRNRCKRIAQRLIGKGISAKPGIYPSVVRFANADPNINSDFKPDVRSLSFSVHLAEGGTPGDGCPRQDVSMQNATTLPHQ